MFWRQVVSQQSTPPEFGQLSRQGRSFSGNERNCCFLNTGAVAPGFANISAVSGFDFPEDGRALCKVDWDQDGYLDFWVSNRNAPRLRFLKNNMPKGNHYLAIRLRGDGISTNRDAIGARVEVVLASPKTELQESKLIRTLHAGEGFLSQSSKWLHFSLGKATDIEQIIVRWQGSDVEMFAGAEVNGRYNLVQGTGQAREVPRVERNINLAESTIELPKTDGAERIPLVSLLPVPKAKYKSTKGSLEPLPIGQGQPLLVNLWATWCGPCLEELADLTRHETELRQSNLAVIALCVDGISGPAGTAEAAANLLDQMKFPFDRGTATEELVKDFQQLHDVLIPYGHELPVPASFLIDEQGRLSVIYKGRVPIDKLLEDVAHSSRPRLERFQQAARFPGSLVDRAVPSAELDRIELSKLMKFSRVLMDAGRIDDARDQLMAGLTLANKEQHLAPYFVAAGNNLGIALTELGRFDEAVEQYQTVVAMSPDYAPAHNGWGIILWQQNRPREAAEKFQQAIRVDPDFVEARFNLGMVLIELSRFDDAAEQFTHILAAYPNFAQAHFGLGTVLAAKGRKQEAIERFQISLRLNPNFTPARDSLRRLQEPLAPSSTGLPQER